MHFPHGSYFSDVASAYRLATLIAVPILLFILWVTVRARSDRAIDASLIAVLTSAYAMLFFTDVLALVSAVTLQAIAILVFAASGLKVRAIAVSSAVSASVVALAFVDRLQWSFANPDQSDGAAAVVLTLAVLLVAGATNLMTPRRRSQPLRNKPGRSAPCGSRGRLRCSSDHCRQRGCSCCLESGACPDAWTMAWGRAA